LTLGVVEVRRDSDHGLSYRFAKVLAGIFYQLAVEPKFLPGELLASNRTVELDIAIAITQVVGNFSCFMGHFSNLRPMKRLTE